TPRLLEERPRQVAEAAARLFFGSGARRAIPLSQGETVRGSSFAHTALEAGVELPELELAEALERIAPRLRLVTFTDRRVLVTPVSALGAPLDATESW